MQEKGKPDMGKQGDMGKKPDEVGKQGGDAGKQGGSSGMPEKKEWEKEGSEHR